MRQALPLVLLFASAAGAQLPSDGRTSYSRDDRIVIPFDLRASDKAVKVTLYYSFDGGPWHEAESVKPGGKREFLFKADRDGPYGFATLTEFKDGTTDPARRDQLTEQKRVVIDKTPPRVQSVRAVTSPEGAPGIEWEVADEFLDPRGIKLEFRWDGRGPFETIDRNVSFSARDSRFWKLQPKERMQVKVVATDRAGNRTESETVWVRGRAADGDDPPVRAVGVGGVRDSAVSPVAGTAQPSLTYVNSKKVTLNVNATVGPSGLKKASLYWSDDKLTWQKHKEDVGPLPAPPVASPDKVRMIPVGFTYEAPKDGLYNFVIVVENHLHSSRPTPKNGEAGEVQVMVDTTKPTVEIISSLVSKNGDRGAVVDIRWRAQDSNIAPMPIKLEYQIVKAADRPTDPSEWKAIAPDWVDNTGQYTWTAPTGEAHLFKIRVTCKDKAGNDASFETREPVNTDLFRPGVDGVDVKPGVSAIRVGDGK